MDFKERGRKGMYFTFDDIEKDSKSFVSNISQEEERQKLAAFLDSYKAKLK